MIINGIRVRPDAQLSHAVLHCRGCSVAPCCIRVFFRFPAAPGSRNVESRRSYEVTTGSRPSAWLPCGSRGLSSSSSSTASPATTGASPTATSTAKNFQVSTPNGQVSLSLDGQLPPELAQSASRSPQGPRLLARALWVVRVRRRSSPRTPPPSRPRTAFAFYKGNSKLTTSDQKSVGTGAHYVGRAKITAPYTGSVTVVSHSGTTYIVIVLTSSPRSSPSASPTAS